MPILNAIRLGRLALAPLVELTKVQAAIVRFSILHWPNTSLGYTMRRTYLRHRVGSLGKNLVMDGGCSIVGHQVHIGDDCMIGHGCVINLGPGEFQFRMGDRTHVGPGLYVRNMNHRYDDPNTPISDQGYFGSDIVIGKDVWIGGRCILLAGTRIGDHCVIGAGSVVSTEIPPYSVVVGNPARVIKRRTHRG